MIDRIEYHDGRRYGLVSGGDIIRYCFECGMIGEELPENALACCPDNRYDYIRRDIAEQAKAGLAARRSDDQLLCAAAYQAAADVFDRWRQVASDFCFDVDEAQFEKIRNEVLALMPADAKEAISKLISSEWEKWDQHKDRWFDAIYRSAADHAHAAACEILASPAPKEIYQSIRKLAPPSAKEAMKEYMVEFGMAVAGRTAGYGWSIGMESGKVENDTLWQIVAEEADKWGTT